MNESLKKFEKELTPETRLIEEYLTFFKPLDHVRRYGNKSGTKEEAFDLNQSVTEHVSGMSYLAEFILERDDKIPETINKDRVRKMILVHDLHEYVLDDLVYKTPQRRLEEEQWDNRLSKAFEHGGDNVVRELLNEYKNKSTPEAQIVRGLDRLEANLTMFYADRVDKMINREADTLKLIEDVSVVSPLLGKCLETAYSKLKARRDEVGQGELDLTI